MTILRMLLFAALFSVLLSLPGAALGLGLGALISYFGKMSCFEGGCDIFVVTTAVAGGLLGAAIGVGLGFWLGWRSARPITPS